MARILGPHGHGRRPVPNERKGIKGSQPTSLHHRHLDRPRLPCRRTLLGCHGQRTCQTGKVCPEASGWFKNITYLPLQTFFQHLSNPNIT